MIRLDPRSCNTGPGGAGVAGSGRAADVSCREASKEMPGGTDVPGCSYVVSSCPARSARDHGMQRDSEHPWNHLTTAVVNVTVLTTVVVIKGA